MFRYHLYCVILSSLHNSVAVSCGRTIQLSRELSLSHEFIFALSLSLCHTCYRCIYLSVIVCCYSARLRIPNPQCSFLHLSHSFFSLFPHFPIPLSSFTFLISIPLFSLSSSLFFSLLLSASAYRFSKRKACVCFSFHTVFIPTTFIYPQPYDTFIHHTRQKCICHKNIHTHIRARKLHMRKLSYAHVCIHPYIHAPIYSHPYSAYIHTDIRACTQARTHTQRGHKICIYNI